jgi:hypothetical protein
MNAKLALAIWLSVCFVGIAVPAIIGILIGYTPNTLIASADAGKFISSNASAGGFFTPGITTIQTTTGSFIVWDQLSAQRGQPLQATETLKDGVQICVMATPRVCANLAGQWPGTLQVVPHTRHIFAPLVTHLGASGAAAWLMLGLLASLTAGVLVASVIEPSDPTKANVQA